MKELETAERQAEIQTDIIRYSHRKKDNYKERLKKQEELIERKGQ